MQYNNNYIVGTWILLLHESHGKKYVTHNIKIMVGYNILMGLCYYRPFIGTR